MSFANLLLDVVSLLEAVGNSLLHNLDSLLHALKLQHSSHMCETLRQVDGRGRLKQRTLSLILETLRKVHIGVVNFLSLLIDCVLLPKELLRYLHAFYHQTYHMPFQAYK